MINQIKKRRMANAVRKKRDESWGPYLKYHTALLNGNREEMVRQEAIRKQLVKEHEEMAKRYEERFL